MTYNSSPSISSISTATISIQASIDSISTSSTFNFMEKQVSTMQPRLEEVVKNPKKTKLKTSTKNSQYLRSSQSSVVINGTTSSSPSITNQKEKPTTSKTYYQKKKERLALEALQASLNNPSASVNNSITSSNSGISNDNKTSLDELKLPYNNPKIYSNPKDETDSSDGSDESSDEEDGTSKKRRKIQRKWDQDRCDLGWRWNWLELQIHDLHHRLKDEDKKTLENKITSSSSSSSLSTSSSAHRTYKKQKTQSQPVTPTLQVPITRSSSTLSLSPNSQLLISDQPLPVQIPVNNNKKQKTVYKRKKVNHPLFKTPRTRKKSNKQSQSISHSNSSHSIEVMDEDVVNDDDEYEEYILSDSDEDMTYRDMKRSTRSSLTSSSGLISPRASRDATPRSLKRSSRSRDFDLDNVIIPNDGLSTPVTPRLTKEILTPVCKELKEDPFEESLFSRLNSGSGTTTPTNISRSPSLTKMVESTEISLKMEVDSQQVDATVREITEISSSISRSVSEIELSTPPNGLASAHESSDEDDTDDEKIEQRHLFRELLEKKRCLFLDLKPPSCPEKLPLEYFIVGDTKKKNKAVDPKKIQKLEEEIKEMRQNYYNCSKFPYMNWVQHGIAVLEIETQRAQQREKERLERERYEREKIENRKLRMSQKKYISKKKSQTCQESPENAVEDVGRDYEMEQLDSSYHSSDEDFLLFQDLEDFFSEEEDEEEEQNVKESEFKPKKQYNTNKQKWKNVPSYTIIIDKTAPLDDQNRERNIIYLKKLVVPTTTEDNSEKKESNSMEVDQSREDKTEVTDTSSPVGSVNNEEISESTQINLSMDDRLLLEQECPTDADNNVDGTTDVMTNPSSSSSDKSKKNLPAGVRVVMSDSMECLSNQLPNLDTNLSLSSSTSSNQGQPLSSPTVTNINSKRDEVEEKTDTTNVDNGSNGSNDGSMTVDVDNKKIEKTQTQTERAFNETLLEDSKIQSTVE